MRRERKPLILWENRDFVAIDKPAGMLSVHRDGERNHSALEAVSEYLRSRGNARARAALVHRLDRDTSGILLFAKNARAKKAMMDGWNELVTEKTYVALAEGRLEGNGTIDIWLMEGKDLKVRPARPGTRGALPAVSSWETVAASARFSLLNVTIETGRKHQIRAHLSAIGHPITGDVRYGAKSDPLGRLGLHASFLAFSDPFSGDSIAISSETPREFRRILDFP